MATVIRENIGLLNDKLIVKIEKSDYLPAFEKKLKEFGKTANIPGFRKGMVPAGMIKKLYGTSIFNDEVLKGVETKLYEYLNEEKPDIFAQPIPLVNDVSMLDINNPGDYEFGFEIGLKPDFEIPSLGSAALTLHEVQVTDAMIDEEINRMQIKGGEMTEPEVIDNPENVLNVMFTECDASGQITEGGISRENSVLLKYFSPVLQEKLKGLKKGDSIVFKIKEAFDADKLGMMLSDLGLDAKDEQAAEKFFKLEVVKIGLIEKKAMTEDFFNEVFPGKDIKDEATFRATLEEEIKTYWNSRSQNQLHDQLYHFLIDNTRMDFPESFLKKWLQTGTEKPKTAEEAERDFPSFSNQLKWSLITDKLIKDNKLEVNAEELRNHMRTEVMRYFGNMNMGEDMSWLDSYLDRMMKDEKQVESTYHRLVTEKMFKFMTDQVKPTVKQVSAEELAAMEHHHEH
ncbi:MAG TPA: trigger factor [Ferruginibacter sp.]|nr:trigger factor [Ferruginibacter sp.]HRN91479.1 trigger factor [Ferruginibacter sp.]HRO05179.1 trigger factor [Ferruginibacter sp.]HRO95516.1 trigger factor [Ferruginibacter sp.]HRP50271.1 trigger factor [Ferruginibacter sp.]